MALEREEMTEVFLDTKDPRTRRALLEMIAVFSRNKCTDREMLGLLRLLTHIIEEKTGLDSKIMWVEKRELEAN